MRGYNRGCHPVREVREGCSGVSEVSARGGGGGIPSEEQAGR